MRVSAFGVSISVECSKQASLGSGWSKPPPVPCPLQPRMPWAVRGHIMPRLRCGCRQASSQSILPPCVLRCCRRVFGQRCSYAQVCPRHLLSPCSPCPPHRHRGEAAAWHEAAPAWCCLSPRLSVFLSIEISF